MYAQRVDLDKASQEARLPQSLVEYEELARKALPAALHYYVAGYSEDGAAHARNLKAFRQYAFVPEILVDVSRRTSATSLFGTQYKYPFGIAPMGSSRLMAKDADVVLARVAASAEIPFVLSGASLTPMEEVRQAGSTSWFQAYIPGEEDRYRALMERVETAGFDTLVLTVDTAVQGAHELAARYGFRSPVRFGPNLARQTLMRPRWLWNVMMRNRLGGLRFRFENMDASPGPFVFSPNLVRDIGKRDALSWKHIEAIRNRWSGKLVIKGIMAPADAVRASKLGVDGIIVSNHGGRQSDAVVSTLDALEMVAQEDLPLAIIYDGGIRRGSDILKALRLGANFVFVGRPMLQAIAWGGALGVSHAIALMAAEISLNMGLLGIDSLSDLSRIEIRKMPDFKE